MTANIWWVCDCSLCWVASVGCIINAKNEQIKKLQEENKELKKVKGNFSARNVIAQSGSKVTTMDKRNKN